MMKARLEKRLSYLSEGTRRDVIDSILAELRDPTPFMLEAGALSLEHDAAEPVKTRLRWAFRAMVSEAAKGG
jgi:hypothetical protein